MVIAILKELELRQDYLGGEMLETIYFGGGTPSLLDEDDLSQIFEAISCHFRVVPDAEITLEANPDDLDRAKLQMLRQTPVNRLSIGIQSFFDADLRYMNRAHDATTAHQSLENARDAGFENLTIDLIYGAPTTDDRHWVENLETAFGYDIPHLSCYCLTVEPKTALAHFVKTGKTEPVDEERAAAQFDRLVILANERGFEHYEISNFAKPGWHSRHNASYWKGSKYLGIGPSAHSYDGRSRQWNVANNAQYLKALKESSIPFEREVLRPEQQYNEYVMTSLRTSWGCDVRQIKAIGESFETHFQELIGSFEQQQLVSREGSVYRLTQAGKLLSDRIAASLFF